ncbi:MAG: elongation factor P [Acidimicrobiia bacterium]|nr:elongation factor P [Acidimicrobiia bacterium]
MPQITSSDFKNGKTLLLDGVLFQIVEFQHVKPGKGHAFVRTKLKNLENGGVVDKTFRTDEKVEQAVIERSEMQFLYRDGDDYVFMDSETYDQTHVAAAVVGDQGGFIKDGSIVVVPFHDGRALGVELPAAVVLEVTETEPGVKGDRVSGATKAATLETGIRVAVPLFVETGTKIKVDTREGTYLSRES